MGFRIRTKIYYYCWQRFNCSFSNSFYIQIPKLNSGFHNFLVFINLKFKIVFNKDFLIMFCVIFYIVLLSFGKGIDYLEIVVGIIFCSTGVCSYNINLVQLKPDVYIFHLVHFDYVVFWFNFIFDYYW